MTGNISTTISATRWRVARCTNGDHFYTGFAQQGVGVGIAVVADNHAGLQCHHVIAVVPLLTFGGEGITASFDDAQFFQAQRFADHVNEAAFLLNDGDTAVAAFIGVQGERNDLVHDFREDGDQVVVAEAENGVQVHRCAGFWQARDDDAFNRFVFEQVLRQLANGLTRGAFAHTDQYHAFTDWHHVTALQAGVAVVNGWVAVPNLEVGVGELRVELVNRRGQKCFLTTGWPVHRVQRHATVNPAGGVTGELGIRQRRQDKAGVTQHVAEHLDGLATKAVWQIIRRHAANQVFRCFAWFQTFKPSLDLVDQTHAHLVRRYFVFKNPVQRFWNGNNVCQQVVHF